MLTVCNTRYIGNESHPASQQVTPVRAAFRALEYELGFGGKVTSLDAPISFRTPLLGAYDITTIDGPDHELAFVRDAIGHYRPVIKPDTWQQYQETGGIIELGLALITGKDKSITAIARTLCIRDEWIDILNKIEDKEEKLAVLELVYETGLDTNYITKELLNVG